MQNVIDQIQQHDSDKCPRKNISASPKKTGASHHTHRDDVEFHLVSDGSAVSAYLTAGDEPQKAAHIPDRI